MDKIIIEELDKKKWWALTKKMFSLDNSFTNKIKIELNIHQGRLGDILVKPEITFK